MTKGPAVWPGPSRVNLLVVRSLLLQGIGHLLDEVLIVLDPLVDSGFRIVFVFLDHGLFEGREGVVVHRPVAEGMTEGGEVMGDVLTAHDVEVLFTLHSL